MGELLKDTMRDRAAAIGAPDLDLDAIIAAGDRRVRRRRPRLPPRLVRPAPDAGPRHPACTRRRSAAAGATIHWQASCVAVIGLAIGIPAGIAIGRRIHNAIADSIGVVPSVSLPVVFFVVVVVGVVVVANLAAMAPARRATRALAATMLQEEPA